ncbi:hypothetical protein ACWGS9_30010 [Bradyrhizobium sp. Arg314]
MATGPIPASRKALAKAGWAIGDVELVEGQRGLRRTGLRGQQGPRLGSWHRHVNGGAIAPSTIRSAHPAPAC